MAQSSLAFHLAIPVSDLTQARHFYGELLGCREGRSTRQWVDFDFFGHQLSVHLGADPRPVAGTGQVDGRQVAIPHFGVVLDWNDFEALAQRLRRLHVAFLAPPTTRFSNEAGEQCSFFLRDPGGNTLEFKTFRDPNQLFSG